MEPIQVLNIGFIGGGNMAKAICEGMIKSGVTNYSKIYVSGPHLETLEDWKVKGAHVSTKNGAVVEAADIIILAVKPHILKPAIKDAVASISKTRLAEGKLFISILAGTTLEVLKSELSVFGKSRIIRVMPNTPLMVGAGCVCYCLGDLANEYHADYVLEIFKSSAPVCEEVPESLINAFGALAGSGPAYGYLIIEALADGGVKQGLPRALALKSAAQTMLGAAKMVLETGKHPGMLKDEVCSPGGTTIAAMHALEKGGVRGAMIDAVEAAAERTKAVEKQQSDNKNNK